MLYMFIYVYTVMFIDIRSVICCNVYIYIYMYVQYLLLSDDHMIINPLPLLGLPSGNQTL